MSAARVLWIHFLESSFGVSLFLAGSPALPVSPAPPLPVKKSKQEVQTVMAGEASEIKLEDETWSPDPNENDFARTTASNCPPSEGSEFPLAGGEITVREGFIATPDQLVQEQFTVSVELPEPAVGAEVDCEARSFKSEENATNTPACNTRSPAPGRGGRRRTMRPEDKNCSGCKIHFERHGRSFNRRAVYTFTTPETVHWAFPDATVHEKSFLCETCAQFIRSKCKRKQSGKRCLWLKPVASKQVRVRAPDVMEPRQKHMSASRPPPLVYVLGGYYGPCTPLLPTQIHTSVIFLYFFSCGFRSSG